MSPTIGKPLPDEAGAARGSIPAPSAAGPGFAAYAATVFVVAWLLWLGGDLIGRQLGAGVAVRSLLYLPGTFAPAGVALAFAFRRGRPAARRLLSRVARWDVPVAWYAFALGFMVAVKLLAAGGHRLLLGSWPAFGTVPLVALFAAALLSAPVQLGEELGWRGHALPLLMERMGVAAAGLRVGVVWALWHLPLFLLPGADLVGQPLPVFVVAVTALSVVMAVVWQGTGGSLPVLMLMHAAVNNTTGVVPAAGPAVAPLSLQATPMAWLTAAILSGAALAALALGRRRRRKP